MKNNTNLLLFMGIALEIALFISCYVLQPNLEETFRHAARYSGRLSFIVFLVTFFLYAFHHPIPLKENARLRRWLLLFAVLHVIHFGFLATNIILNEIPIIPGKLAGGILAYLMIVATPLALHKVKLAWQLVYFYYVSIVMAVTYLSRARGDFEGGEPFWFHYFALGLILFCALFFGWKILKK